MFLNRCRGSRKIAKISYFVDLPRDFNCCVIKPLHGGVFSRHSDVAVRSLILERISHLKMRSILVSPVASRLLKRKVMLCMTGGLVDLTSACCKHFRRAGVGCGAFPDAGLL